MGRTVVIRLVTGEAHAGRVAGRVHDVETDTEFDVRDEHELVATLRSLAGTSTAPTPSVGTHEPQRRRP